MSIICDWGHPDCQNGSKDIRNGYLFRCHILTDCDFPNRKDCPFYKRDKAYIPDGHDTYIACARQLRNNIEADVREMEGITR